MNVSAARFPNGCVCHICNKEVEYRDRKRCIGCGKWFHNWCGYGAWTSEDGVYNHGIFDGRSKCYDCFEPFSTTDHVRATLLELDIWDEKDSVYTSGVIFVASLRLGPNEEKIAEFTGIPLEEVQKRGKLARENRVWTEDGKIAMYLGDGSDPAVANVGMLMSILCLEGMIVRKEES